MKDENTIARLAEIQRMIQRAECVLIIKRILETLPAECTERERVAEVLFLRLDELDKDL